MIFVILYKNAENVREAVTAEVIEAVKQGYNLETQQVKTQNFSSALFWPNMKELANLPSSYQCEQVQFDGEKLISLRKLVFDAEIIKNEQEEGHN